jgi:uncharacterized coiled-coil DUF342 family protein
MRSFGHNVESAQQNVSINVGITYEECERVFNLLINTKEISQEVSRIKNQWSEIYNIMNRLVREINKANSQ